MMLITLFNLIINLGPIFPGLIKHSKQRARNRYLWVKRKKAVKDEAKRRKRRIKKELLFKE